MVKFCAYAKNQYDAYMENKDTPSIVKEALENVLFAIVPSSDSSGSAVTSAGNTPDNIKNFYRERGYFLDGNVYRIGIYSAAGNRFTDVIFVPAHILLTDKSDAIILLVEKFED
jgi:hypothetical protein